MYRFVLLRPHVRHARLSREKKSCNTWFLCLASFTEQNVFKVLPCCSVCQNPTPCYCWKTFRSRIHHDLLVHSSADGHLGCFHTASVHNTALNIWAYVFIYLGYRPMSGLTGHRPALCLLLWGAARPFSTVAAPSHIPLSSARGSNFSTPLPTLGIVGVLYYRQCSGCEGASQAVLARIFLMTSGHLFTCFSATVYLFRRNFYLETLPVFFFFNWSVLLKIELEEVFIYSRYKTLIRYIMCKYFLLLCGLSFHFADGALWRTSF